MLQPKRSKHRKAQKGRIRSEAKRGTTIAFGSFALKALEPVWLTNRQIEAARQAPPTRSDPPPARFDHPCAEQIPIRRHPPPPTHIARGINGDEINGRERQLVHARDSRRRRPPCPTDFLNQWRGCDSTGESGGVIATEQPANARADPGADQCDDQHQDRVVKVSAMQTMFSQLSTPDSLKRSKALPNTGDHVLASPIKSKDIIAVQQEVASFLEELLHLTPQQEQP